jgi:hypothetical protein
MALVPEGMVEAVSKVDRANKLVAFERWADSVEVDDLVVVDTTALKALMDLAEQRTAVEAQLVEAVRGARSDHHSWSEIGLMLGVSKQAAQRKHGPMVAA